MIDDYREPEERPRAESEEIVIRPEQWVQIWPPETRADRRERLVRKQVRRSLRRNLKSEE